MSNTVKLLNAYYENDPLYTPILTLETVQSLYRQLMSINPNTATAGICIELHNLNLEERWLLKALFKIWPECSGYDSFPIETPAHLYSIDADAFFLYRGSSLMWHPKTIYGAARRRLLAFCLSVLEEMEEDQSWAN